MKILIDLTSLSDNFSGIELYALSVAKELIKNFNHSYVLVFKNAIHKDFDIISSNVEIMVLKGKNKLIFNQFILPWHLRKVKADKYLFMAFTEPFFWWKKNSINAIHDVSCWDCPGSNKWYMLLYWKIMFRKVAFRKGVILTVSEFSKKRISQLLSVNLNRIVVTYSAPSPDITTFAYNEIVNQAVVQKYKLPKEYILCLSTLEPRKNLIVFLQAYAVLIKKSLIDIDVVLAGRKGWKIDNLMSCFSDDIKKRIHFTGFIENSELPYVYRNAKLFVFPSKYEGFGVPPLEALCLKVNVLSSDADAMKEVLENNVCFFKNNSVTDLTNKLYSCLIDCKVNNFVIRDEYKWENVSKKVIDVINN